MHRRVLWFVARRIAVVGGLLVVVSFAVFSLLYVAPGSAIDILIGDNARTPELVQALREQHHLNEPFLTQYWIWAKGAFQLDFGTSIYTTLPVMDEIRARASVSLLLGAYAFALTLILGIVLGVVAALRRRSAADRGIVAGAIVGLSTPVFVSGIFLLYVFAVALNWFPVFGRGGGFFDELWHLTLPALALTLHSAAYIVKHTRASMSIVLDQDYVTFARARGLSRARVLRTYCLRNALIPVITISGLVLAGLIVGAVLVEVTFSVPGIGGLLVQSATVKDLPVLQAVAMLIAAVIMLANLAADVAYAAVDPRIRLGRERT